MSITLSALQKQRRDSAANWTAENPTLLAGEIGIESDTGYWKVGDGSTAWTSLAYISGLGAEIPVSRLADGSARQLLQTAANGTDVEWTSNVDIPGTLDVTGAATFDAAVTIQGNLTVNGTTTTIDTQNLIVEDKNVIIGQVTTPTDVTADGGGITLKGTTDKTINWVDATDAWTSSERFSVPTGTAAAPTLTFTGDPNTGIYSPGADQLALSTNGTGRLFVNSSGNVGVGTSSPGRLLSVQGIVAAYNSLGTDDSHVLFVNNGSLSSVQSTFGSTGSFTPLAFFTSNTERLRITSAGLVGVGTSSPSSLLHVTGGSGQLVEFGTGNSLRIGGFGTGNCYVKGNETTISFGNVNAGNTVFLTGDTERVRIDSSGRVGIGTSSPANLLHLYGSAALQNIEPSSTSTASYIRYTGGGSDRAYLGLERGDGGGGIIGSGAYAFVVSTASTNPLVFGTNGTERARIDSSGRLGIGTTPAAWSGFTALEVSEASVASSGGGDAFFSANAYYDGSWKYKDAGVARNIYMNSDGIVFRQAASGSANAGIAWSEQARLDTSGRLLVGTSTSTGFDGASAKLQVENPYVAASFVSRTNDIYGSTLYLAKSRGSGATIVQSGDAIGGISFNGADGSDLETSAAYIQAFVDGTPGFNDMPGRLVFSTTADGASSPTERVRITNSGVVRFVGSALNLEIDPTDSAFYRTGTNMAGISLSTNSILPCENTGAVIDNYASLGNGTYRWSTVYAATGTINTSDANLKQDVENLEQAEINVAAAIKTLIKKFRFIDAVAAKGDDARIHIGVIAQEVEQAFVDEGLDPRKYALFCEDTMESDGSKRLGIRYDELLAFVIAAL